jgi:hypothetical protein
MPNLLFFLCPTLYFSVFLPWQKQELSSHFSVLAWNSKKGSSKLRKEEEAETLHLLRFPSNPQQLSPSFFFLLCSPSFPFFPLPSLPEGHRESERESERPWDREKKLSRRPINRFSSSLCRFTLKPADLTLPLDLTGLNSSSWKAFNFLQIKTITSFTLGKLSLSLCLSLGYLLCLCVSWTLGE